MTKKILIKSLLVTVAVAISAPAMAGKCQKRKPLKKSCDDIAQGVSAGSNPYMYVNKNIAGCGSEASLKLPGLTSIKPSSVISSAIGAPLSNHMCEALKSVTSKTVNKANEKIKSATIDKIDKLKDKASDALGTASSTLKDSRKTVDSVSGDILLGSQVLRNAGRAMGQTAPIAPISAEEAARNAEREVRAKKYADYLKNREK